MNMNSGRSPIIGLPEWYTERGFALHNEVNAYGDVTSNAHSWIVRVFGAFGPVDCDPVFKLLKGSTSRECYHYLNAHGIPDNLEGLVALSRHRMTKTGLVTIREGIEGAYEDLTDLGFTARLEPTDNLGANPFIAYNWQALELWTKPWIAELYLYLSRQQIDDLDTLRSTARMLRDHPNPELFLPVIKAKIKRGNKT